MSKFFINCDQASILSTRGQYGDLNPKEAFRHKLHKGHCISCRSFHKNNERFQRAIKGLKWVSLTIAQKKSIRKCLSEAMMK
ncbi:MAG: spore cortex formation protein SpoVR/YcgB (stage V sporulation) [Nonlabens sp.]|jgi:spore cortex formation protein SpoVR/YcgB (stage V sporulation)